jgi:hypothetical protein
LRATRLNPCRGPGGKKNGLQTTGSLAAFLKLGYILTKTSLKIKLQAGEKYSKRSLQRVFKQTR